LGFVVLVENKSLPRAPGRGGDKWCAVLRGFVSLVGRNWGLSWYGRTTRLDSVVVLLDVNTL
jgi:hypothetical protein